MKTAAIVDTGPLVMFLVKEEAHHHWMKEQFQQLPAPFFTCKPVLTETFFLIRNLPQGPDRFFRMLNSGLLRVNLSLLSEAAALQSLVQKYENVPMSLADACLVRLSELVPDCTIFKLDGDFRIYRRHGRESIPVILRRRNEEPPYRKVANHRDGALGTRITWIWFLQATSR